MIKTIKITTFIACVACASAAQANDFQQAFSQCAETKDSLSRLLCYDQLANRLSSNPAAAANVTLPAKPDNNVPVAAEKAVVAQAQKPESLFGMEHTTREGKADEMLMTIAKLSKNAYGRWRFVFENEQVWQQKEDVKPPSFAVGDVVVIERGMFNSFSLSKKGSNRGLKVKRIK